MVQRTLFLQLFVWDGQHFSVLFGTGTICQFHAVKDWDLGQYATWLSDDVKEQLTFRDGQEDFDFAAWEDVHLVRNLALLEYFLILIKNVDTQADCHFVEDVFWQVEHKLDVFEHFTLPLPVDIVVGKEVLLQSWPDLREHKDHFFELLFLEEADHGVDLGANTGSSRLTCQQTDFTEEIAAFEGSDEHISLRNGVLYVYFALTWLDEEEAVVFLALINQWILWIK